MKLDLLDFLDVALSLCEENLLVVSSHNVALHHGVRLADEFQTLVVQASLNDTVVELHD